METWNEDKELNWIGLQLPNQIGDNLQNTKYKILSTIINYKPLENMS